MAAATGKVTPMMADGVGGMGILKAMAKPI
jgi:hypothetical protein